MTAFPHGARQFCGQGDSRSVRPRGASPTDAGSTLITAVQYTLRVTFTIGAIGTGLAIPTLLMRVRIAGRK